MHQLREHGDVVVRIGRMGGVVAPHYRIERRFPTKSLFGDEVRDGFKTRRLPEQKSPAPRPAGEEFDILHDDHWSSRVMGYAEVAELLRLDASWLCGPERRQAWRRTKGAIAGC